MADSIRAEPIIVRRVAATVIYFTPALIWVACYRELQWGSKKARGMRREIGMADIIATTMILVSVSVTFCAGCYAVAHAAYFNEPSRADLLLAFYRVVVFAGAVVGCLAFSEAYGNAASAVFAVILCGCSIAVGSFLNKTWGREEDVERQRIEELRALVDRYREGEDSVEARCARAARTFDLTRREEEVLALLLEGARAPRSRASCTCRAIR